MLIAGWGEGGSEAAIQVESNIENSRRVMVAGEVRVIQADACAIRSTGLTGALRMPPETNEARGAATGFGKVESTAPASPQPLEWLKRREKLLSKRAVSRRS
ncbi:hypothetical protein GCM10028822_08360 [Hymenobacter terrigena]